ncbi:MAG: SUMF1/EgtB/PvdO family nonheme iron enzyme, partial [Chloroflexi bacterium]|nr:SUMF1/EgtB/PvdO family nonheme iron enzyme [Chloroflexota bacterium]
VTIRRARAEDIIASELPQYLATQLPDDPTARQAMCRAKATGLIEGIKVESGILVELGLDTDGEPLISFSHLTFQEYLAARALAGQPGLPNSLIGNLPSPAWQEVTLLYVDIKQDATSVIQKLIALAERNPEAWLGAARCLNEKVRVAPQEREIVLRGMHSLLSTQDQNFRVRVCELLATVGTLESARVLVDVLEKDSVWDIRYAAGNALGRLGDPRFVSDQPIMLDVPEGEFKMGSNQYSGEKPIHSVFVPRFQISKFPITNSEYKRFMEETGHAAPPDWEEKNFPKGRANHPVVNVSWYDGVEFCNWLSQKTRRNFHLPSEAQWEKAARGTDGREYPWGNEFDSNKCNVFESKIGTTTPVGIYIEGASPCGALDMAGNVLEWCSSLYEPYPFRENDGREKLSAEGARILRGGSWYFDQVLSRCAFRLGLDPHNRFYVVGFRVAESFS